MRVLIIVVALSILALAVPVAQQRVPDVTFEVAVQQREDGKLSRGLHLLQLVCTDQQCSLMTISLNQCGESGEGRPAFSPSVQYSSISDRNLSVTSQGRTLSVRETGRDIGGEYVNTFRFEYHQPAQGKSATELAGFSGGFVKNSAILRKVITVEYVALPRAFQVIPLDCGVLLPGIAAK